MLLACQGYETTVPRWTLVLIAAEKWGMAPWVLAPDARKGSAWWFERWQVLEDCRTAAEDSDEFEDTDG